MTLSQIFRYAHAVASNKFNNRKLALMTYRQRLALGLQKAWAKAKAAMPAKPAKRAPISADAQAQIDLMRAQVAAGATIESFTSPCEPLPGTIVKTTEKAIQIEVTLKNGRPFTFWLPKSQVNGRTVKSWVLAEARQKAAAWFGDRNVSF